MSIFWDKFLQTLHQKLDLEQREILPASEVDEHGLGVFEQRALI